MILDMTCGYRSMWFQKQDKGTIYLDKRNLEKHRTPDNRFLEVRPTVQADNRCLPFKDDVFNLVLFDPPHIITDSFPQTNLTIKYGYLRKNSFVKDFLYAIREGFRVLKNNSFLILKWNTTNKTLRQILSICPVPPLFGTQVKSNYKNETWFLVFRKENVENYTDTLG